MKCFQIVDHDEEMTVVVAEDMREALAKWFKNMVKGEYLTEDDDPYPMSIVEVEGMVVM